MKRILIAIIAFLSISLLPYPSLKASAIGGPDCGGCGPSCGPCAPCGPCCNPCDCCCNPFDGFYVGANIGWAIRDFIWTDRNGWGVSFDDFVWAGSLVHTEDGVAGGFQVGYNWVCCNALLGAEFDWTWVDHCNSRNYENDDGGDFSRFRLSDEGHWFGTIRGRAGITACNLLLYGTLGAAFAHHHHRWSVSTQDGSERFNHCETHWGLAIGTGVEWALSCLISLKAEGLLLKFAEHDRSFFSNRVSTPRDYRFDFSSSIWLARVGINFNLSGLCGCCW